MDKPCSTCSFFRPFRPLSQLIAHELGVQDQALVSELVRMMQDERQKQDREFDVLIELRQTNEEAWRTRPEMSDYCGLKEAKGVSILHARKNPEAKCDDWKAAKEKPVECSKCRHVSTSKGYEEDRRMIDEIKTSARNAAILGQGGRDQLLSNYLHQIGLMKSLEAAQCYYARKLTYKEPKYLAYCKKFSTYPDFVPCVIQNRHQTCSFFEDAAESGSAPSSSSNTSSSIVSDLRDKYGIATVNAGQDADDAGS